MSFWMVLVATLLIGGVFMWSMLTAANAAARDADRWNRGMPDRRAQRSESDWADTPGPWIGPKGEK